MERPSRTISYPSVFPQKLMPVSSTMGVATFMLIASLQDLSRLAG
jgi:hypothetical protein